MGYYGLNSFLYDLRELEARATYQADPDAVIARYELSDEERALIEARDWNGLFAAGGNVYLLPNLGKAAGASFPEMGAQMRGETTEQWAQSLEAQNERIAPFALVPTEQRNG